MRWESCYLILLCAERKAAAVFILLSTLTIAMERKDDYHQGPLAAKEVSGTSSKPSVYSPSSSTDFPPYNGSEEEGNKAPRQTEMFAKYQREREDERRKRMEEIMKNDREAQHSKDFDGLEGERLRTMIRYKLKQMEDEDESLIDREADALLPDSHHILFKMSDYVSIPKKMNSSTIMSQIIGGRLIDKDGNYMKGDEGRFLLIFHDVYSFVLIFMALMILFAQYQLLQNLYKASGTHICDNDLYFNTSNPSWEVVFLCVIYAAGQATEDFFVVVPYEIIGKNVESYCIYVHERVRKRLPVGRTFWFEAFRRFLTRKSSEGKDKDSIYEGDVEVHIASRFRVLADLIVAVAVFFANVSMVILTVLVMGYQIAYSSGTVDMIQNFIAVEIILHVNEVIPRMFWIRDLSPYRFRKSLFEVLHQLEEINAIPRYYKDVDGADTHRIRWSYSRWRSSVFAYFTIIMCTVLLFVTYDYREKCGYGEVQADD